MSIFVAMLGGIWAVTNVVWSSLAAFAWVVLVSPICLLNLVQIKNSEVRVFRLIFFIPYWIHRVPRNARFDLYEAFEDSAPTGVAFEASSYGADPLHLGTARSAEPLYAHLGKLLRDAGWEKATFGYMSPADGSNAL